MEAGSRKRCHVAAVSLAVLLVLVWIHGEAITVKLVETKRQYIKIGSSVNRVTRPQRNETNATMIASDGRNAPTVVARPVSNETLASSVSQTHVSNTTNKTTTSKNAARKNATIVVFLSGEMGNHLSILAKAHSVALMAQEQYGISTNLIFRHQSHPKWVHGQEAIQKCFPKLRHYNFSAANSQAFDELAVTQDRILLENQWAPARLKLDSDQDDKHTIDEALAYWKRMLDSPTLVDDLEQDAAAVSIPFLTVASWCPLDLLDQYLDEIRSFFEFDKNACCKIQPDPDESVFHLRNFLVEMPRKGKVYGYEELSPNKTASELFAHLHQGEKVAITTRFGGDNVAPYVSALEKRGLRVRVIENQTGTEDFCFLMSAEKELVGTLLSTFAAWAAYLGDMKRANLYRVQSPNTREISHPPFNWTHAELKGRVFSETYKSEEQDAWEANEQQGRMLLFQEWSEI